MPRKRKSSLSRLSSQARAKRIARSLESLEDAELRRQDQVDRQAALRATESDAQSQQRRQEQAERQAALRAAESIAQTQQRLHEQAVRQAALRAVETPNQTQQRLSAQTERQAALRAAETPEEAQARRDSNAQQQLERRRNFQRNTWSVFYDAAFNYDPLIDYKDHRLIIIGLMDKTCRFCSALKWKDETAGMCCSNGKVSLPSLGEPEEPLKTLFIYDADESRRFLNRIRKYNSCFQMTSFGVDREVIMPGFSPTFTVQGQIYHRIGSLFPAENEQHKFLQVYFMGDEELEANRRCQFIQGVERETVMKIQTYLHEHNILVNTFKTALENIPEENYKVVIHADKTPRGEHERRYNAPLINEIAAVISGDQFSSRDIVLRAHDDTLQRVADTHKFYDALQYPLIFCKGQEGYHFEIPLINPVTKQPLPNKKVSCMDFYAYHMMVRQNDFNILTRCRQLFHQFLVDMYVKVESERLRYISLNQKKLRVENYIHLQDAVASDANVNPRDLGRMVILPSSFVNSPRYLHEYTQDAFAYVRTYGRPDLFVTFTCNPSWKEITDELMPGQKSTDRHDIVARVFRLKVQKLINVITKGKIFGEVQCFMYSIEWQKRGLPHVHILLWLKEKLRPNQIDDIISAEIPDPEVDKDLYDTIVRNMVHGPCGTRNSASPCMKEGKCTKKFPKQLLKETVHNDNGYPLYRRRSPEDGGRKAQIKTRSGALETVDNSWIVPYSPILCKMFNAHINVEACNSVRAIKYICKYINKGSDQAIFNLRNNGDAQPLNEVQTFQAGRYVSSNEAAWRLLGFPLHERHPTVTHLAVHLENGERVYFTERNFQERLSSPPKTTLTAFFQLCQTDPFAKTLLYAEVPRYYTWNASRKEWKRRIQGARVEDWPGVKSSDALGRVYTVHVTNMECYCLRLLLHHVRGPTSYRDLKIVNGQECATYREACETQRLLENDNHWDETMEEAVQCQSPAKIRDLYATLISSCGLSNPTELWEKYKEYMAEDILRRMQQTHANITYNDFIFNEALGKIEDKVMAMVGKKMSDFGMVSPRRTNENELSDEILRETNYDIQALQQQVAECVPQLLPEQKQVFDQVLQQIESGNGALFFLDAPGGTGKTFLLNLLLAQVRKDSNIAVAVASSGIAATLLSGGRTAHSVLKLPLNLAHEETPICNFSKNSARGTMLRQCKLLVWDESTMSHKKAVEALNRTLQDLRNSTDIMGGMVVLLAGDFRQTLPVIQKGTPADEIKACIKSSTLWSKVIKFSLTTNMRVHLYNDINAGNYADTLLKIGDGRLESDAEGKVMLTRDFCYLVQSGSELIEMVYPGLQNNIKEDQWLCQRAILAPKNDIVNKINFDILSQVSGETVEYLSVDSVMDTEQSTSYPVEFLNSLELSGVPSHKLQLKVGVPVMLMRNLDAPRLCNGTRLRVTQLGRNIIGATILTGVGKGENVIIPRIPIIPTDLPFQFKRLQFPIKLSFAMTINKAQGQTLKVAGVNLEKPCFSHGQLYVACSRVSNAQNLFILSPDGKTYNIVYNSVLK